MRTRDLSPNIRNKKSIIRRELHIEEWGNGSAVGEQNHIISRGRGYAGSRADDMRVYDRQGKEGVR